MGDEIAHGVVEEHGLGFRVMIAGLGSDRFRTRDIVENSKNTAFILRNLSFSTAVVV